MRIIFYGEKNGMTSLTTVPLISAAPTKIPRGCQEKESNW